jgi:hypothetical protein
MIIFETDGVPNNVCTANFTNGGQYTSYYNIRQPVEYPTSVYGDSFTNSANAAVNVAQVICDYPTGNRPNYNTGKSGYSTQGKPVLIHALGFGGIMEINNSLTTNVLTFLQQVQYVGSTQPSASTPLPSYKIITGTSQQRINNLRQAFTIMMQDGVQVSLFQ